MNSKLIIFILILCVNNIYCAGVSPCPISNHNGNVYSGIFLLYSDQIIASFNEGVVPLI